MSERKVLNKYYPPDFDVTKLPKLNLSRDRQFVIRIMAPFSMRCKTCGDYIYKGRKFNARQETVQDETYLGLRIFRFYIRCPKCLSEITFKTDPENTDYQMEEGATRNFQARKLAQQEDERMKKEKEDDELNNPMKALENRTKESKQEMDLLEKLEELKDLNQRHAKVDHEQLLKDNYKSVEEVIAQQEKDDEALVRELFQNAAKPTIRRLEQHDSDEEETPSVSKAMLGQTVTDILTTEGASTSTSTLAKKPKEIISKDQGKVSFGKGLKGLIVLKKKRNTDTEIKTIPNKISKPSESISNSPSTSREDSNSKKSTTGCASLGLLGDYDSSSSENGE